MSKHSEYYEVFIRLQVSAEERVREGRIGLAIYNYTQSLAHLQNMAECVRDEIKNLAHLADDKEKELAAFKKPMDGTIAARSAATGQPAPVVLLQNAAATESKDGECDCGCIESGRHHALCPTQRGRK